MSWNWMQRLSEIMYIPSGRGKTCRRESIEKSQLSWFLLQTVMSRICVMESKVWRFFVFMEWGRIYLCGRDETALGLLDFKCGFYGMELQNICSLSWWSFSWRFIRELRCGHVVETVWWWGWGKIYWPGNWLQIRLRSWFLGFSKLVPTKRNKKARTRQIKVIGPNIWFRIFVVFLF